MAFCLSIFGQGTVPADKAQRKQLNPDDSKRMIEGSIKIDDLETRDGVYLSARYWPASDRAKECLAVILVHGKERYSARMVFTRHKLSGRAKDEANPEVVSKYNMAFIAFDFRGTATVSTSTRSLQDTEGSRQSEVGEEDCGKTNCSARKREKAERKDWREGKAKAFRYQDRPQNRFPQRHGTLASFWFTIWKRSRSFS